MTVEASRSDFTSFSSWGEIFPDAKAENFHFQGLVGDLVEEYVSNHTFQNIVRFPGKFGEQVVIYKNNKGMIVVSHTENNNLEVIFSNPSHSDHVSFIPAHVGSKDHSWTREDVQECKKGLLNFIKDSEDVNKNLDAITLHSYVRGNLATEREQQNLIESDFVPLRIGYEIYPDRMLEKAKAFLSKETL